MSEYNFSNLDSTAKQMKIATLVRKNQQQLRRINGGGAGREAGKEQTRPRQNSVGTDLLQFVLVTVRRFSCLLVGFRRADADIEQQLEISK